MHVWRQPHDLRAACDAARNRGLRVGLVPTMGALHAGHIRLLEEARALAAFVVATIFVNPTQFGPEEDLARYPRTLDRDLAICDGAGVSGVLAPSDDAMYRPGDETRVRVGQTAASLCGAHRPNHFEGVATVVVKLLALAGPSVAFFGRKDYQQLQVIRRVADDLFLPVEIVGVPTVREPDGLALSSRNAYLSEPARRDAVAIPRGLADAVQIFARGERRAGALTDAVRARVERIATSIDYIEAADPITVVPYRADTAVGERALLAVAVRLGGTRLIDNVVLGEESAPPGGDT